MCKFINNLHMLFSKVNSLCYLSSFLAWIRNFVCDSFIYFKTSFLPFSVQIIKSFLFSLKDLPIRFMSSAYSTICTDLYL